MKWIIISSSLVFLLSCSQSKKIISSAGNPEVVCATGSLKWHQVSSPIGSPVNKQLILPKSYTAYQIDESELRTLMTLVKSGEEEVITLPVNGECLTFRLVPSGVMSPELAEKFPELQSYRGIGTGQASDLASIDYDGKLLRVSVSTGRGTFILDPFEMEDGTYYLMFDKKNSGIPKVKYE
ncbi:MAG: hypothetical protein KL787_07945 [Taibaiella sp.]|nr:hypothetical protein [Taibaiella sp.]